MLTFYFTIQKSTICKKLDCWVLKSRANIGCTNYKQCETQHRALRESQRTGCKAIHFNSVTHIWQKFLNPENNWIITSALRSSSISEGCQILSNAFVYFFFLLLLAFIWSWTTVTSSRSVVYHNSCLKPCCWEDRLRLRFMWLKIMCSSILQKSRG